MTDDRMTAMLDDLIDSFRQLRRTFLRHHLNPPVSMQVDFRTHDDLKRLRHVDLVWFPDVDGGGEFKMQICGITIERAPA